MIPSYCISGYESRKQKAKQHFAEHGFEPTFIQAVHGKSWGITSTIPYELDCTDYKINGKHCGVILTHWFLWQHLLLNKTPEALIFEDDAKLVPNFWPKFRTAYESLPENWQLVFVGYLEDPEWISQHKKVASISDTVMRTQHLFGTHCYLVRHNALQTLLDTNCVAWSPVDIQINYLSLPNLVHYTLTEPLATQHEDPEEFDDELDSINRVQQEKIHAGIRQATNDRVVSLSGGAPTYFI